MGLAGDAEIIPKLSRPLFFGGMDLLAQLNQVQKQRLRLGVPLGVEISHSQQQEQIVENFLVGAGRCTIGGQALLVTTDAFGSLAQLPAEDTQVGVSAGDRDVLFAEQLLVQLEGAGEMLFRSFRLLFGKGQLALFRGELGRHQARFAEGLAGCGNRVERYSRFVELFLTAEPLGCDKLFLPLADFIEFFQLLGKHLRIGGAIQLGEQGCFRSEQGAQARGLGTQCCGCPRERVVEPRQCHFQLAGLAMRSVQIVERPNDFGVTAPGKLFANGERLLEGRHRFRGRLRAAKTLP